MIETKRFLADFRLYQLMSPSLPIGAFTYSQGLEWAVEHGWVTDQKSLQKWLEDMLHHSLVTMELPLLQRLYQAMNAQDIRTVNRWSQWLYACRETKEMRLEEKQRGLAAVRLLRQLDQRFNNLLDEVEHYNQLVAFALAANLWQIDSDDLCAGYLWSWLENATMAGVKLIPLGQTQGQQILLEVSTRLPEAIAASRQVEDHEIGSFTPAQAIASSRHETQYTRLYRS